MNCKHLIEWMGLKPYKTTVLDSDEYRHIFHHNNLIAKFHKRQKCLEIWNQGYWSKTTKERLSAVLGYYQLGHLYQRNFTWYLQDSDNNTTEFNGYAILWQS